MLLFAVCGMILTRVLLGCVQIYERLLETCCHPETLERERRYNFPNNNRRISGVFLHTAVSGLLSSGQTHHVGRGCACDKIRTLVHDTHALR